MITAQTAPRTLSEALLPRMGQRDRWMDLLLVTLFSGLIAGSAQFRVYLPNNPVPITGQTFAVLFTGAALGYRRAFAAVVLYLLEGLVGLPVFAGGNLGAVVLLGATGGYLLALPVAAACAGWLAERGWDRTPARAMVSMALADGIVFLAGVLWLSHMIGIGPALAKGLLPFLPGEAIKVALAATLLPVGWALAGRSRSQSR
jgi:biotin transport system substrate-specific component